MPTATITYLQPSYCQILGPSDAPVINGPAGGTFSSGPGLSIDGATGVINSGSSSIGHYVVTYLFSANGCSNTTTTNVAIEYLPDAQASADNLTPCVGHTVQLHASGGITYTWRLGDQNGAFISSDPNPLVVVPNAAQVTYWVDVATICSDAPATVTINPKPSPAPVIDGPSTVCLNVTDRIYNVTGTGITSYNWTISGGTITSATNTNSVNVTWTSTGNHSISVDVGSANGCNTITTYNVTVITIPDQPGIITGSSEPCEGSTQTYSVPNIPGINYAWSYSRYFGCYYRIVDMVQTVYQ